MSTESVDPDLVEQTRQQIAALVREIEQLARSDAAPSEFYEGFLNRVVQALAAVGGAVWAPNDSGQLALQYQINLQLTDLARNPEAQQQHGLLLQRVLTSGEGQIVSPHSGGAGDEEAGNPTDFLLVLGPLKTDRDTRGIVEIFQRSDTTPVSQRGYLRFLLQMCERASEFLKTRALRHFSDRQTLWTQLENFTRASHASLDLRQTAYTIANEGRRLIGCDRVSIAIQRGKHCRIEAMSNQDQFDKRSTTVTLLNKLATAVTAAGDALWYTGDTSKLAPQVERALEEYVDESHSKTVAVLPLSRPRPPEHTEDEPAPPIVGALIVEQIEDSRLRDGFIQRVEVVCDHSSTALANCLEHHDLFLLPVWKTLGKASWVVRGRTLPKTMSIAAAVGAALLALVLVRADFRLEGKGELKPVVRRDVFAGEDGTVKEVLVGHNANVKKAAPLVRLESSTLQVEIERTLGELNKATQELLATDGRLRHTLEVKDKSERDRLLMQKMKLDVDVASFQEQLKLLRLKEQDLVVLSPIEGQLISSWNVLNELQGRPVKRGDVLLQVADPSLEWELEVQMPEDRMGHVVEAQRAITSNLKVGYILATDPSTSREGEVKEVHYSAEVRGDEGNTVLLRVKIDKEDLARENLLRPGASVTAQVYCGRRSIGYVWFHDLLEWWQKTKFRYLW